MNPPAPTRLAVVEASLAPHVLDLLDAAGIAGTTTRLSDGEGLVAIAVDATHLERARATLDLVLPGLLQDQSPGQGGDGQPLSGRLIRRSDWGRDTDDDVGSAPQPSLLDGRSAFADAVTGGTATPGRPEDDVDDFVPPEPPPLPRGDTVSRFAWLGAVGGPILLVLSALLGLSSIIAGIGLAGFVAGFGVLVARMPDRARQDDGWDDGAVL